MHRAGEKPGSGTYYCNMCGHEIVLTKKDETLPPCPKCAHTGFTK